MSLVYKKKYEDRAEGFEDILGQEVNIVWGDTPKTDGYNIWLPDKKLGIWDNEEMIRCGFNHEIAHIMFDTDTKSMGEWVTTWSNRGDKFNWHDPYDLIEEVANGVIQSLEDQRIESLYGELKPGSRDRFRDISHKRIAEKNDVDSDPATALLILRCSKWNMVEGDGKNYYPELCEIWGNDLIDFFYSSLDDVEGAAHDVVYLKAEQVMDRIFPWYEERIRFQEDEELQDIQENLEGAQEDAQELGEEFEDLQIELEETKQEIREAEANDDWERAEELEDELDNIEDELNDVEHELDRKEAEVEKLESQAERKSERVNDKESELEEIREVNKEHTTDDELENEDFDPPESVFSGRGAEVDEEDIEESEELMSRRLDSMRSQDGRTLPDVSPQESMEADVAKKDPVGSRKGEIYHGIVEDISREFKRIYGRKQHQLATVGESINIDALIQNEVNQTLDTEIMNREISETGFSVVVVLDLSFSMAGSKLNICRNIGGTLSKSFENIEDMGIPVDFQVIGYGGSHSDNKVLVKECENTDDVLKLTHDPNFPNTPTWLGIEFAREKVHTNEGIIFMVIVTDGTPTGVKSNGEQFNTGRALSYTKQELEKCRAVGLTPFTLGIGVNLADSEMRRVYGNYENFDSESEAAKLLLEYVRGTLRKHVEML